MSQEEGKPYLNNVQEINSLRGRDGVWLIPHNSYCHLVNHQYPNVVHFGGRRTCLDLFNSSCVVE